jgi:hypothetical protein
MHRRALLAFAAGLAAAVAVGWAALPTLLYARAEQPLRFSHRTHTSEKVGSECDDCHAFSADGRFAGVPRLEACAGCHAEAQGASAEEKRLVEEYVKPGKEIPWLVYARQPEHVFFPHAEHVKRAGLACEECHGGHGQTDALRPFESDRVTGESRDVWGPSMSRLRNPRGQGMKMSDCEACHAARGRSHTACLACHK